MLIALFILTAGFANPNHTQRHERIRRDWQVKIAKRLNRALWVAFMSAKNPDALNTNERTAKFLGMPMRKLSAWMREEANISVGEGLRAARALNSAPWFLLGWDILSRAYWNDVTDYETHEVKPAVLAEIPGPLFREMVRAARKGWRFDVIRPDGQHFEPALCAANLTDAGLISRLEERGYEVRSPSRK